MNPSKDLSGLTEHERQQSDWVAFDVFVPADVARSIRRWELSNVSLNVFRCNKAEDYYPADARMAGKPLRYEDLKEPLPPSTKLTFYLPKQTAPLETNVCAALDARGYSPIFLRSQTIHMPSLNITFPHYDEKTGRIASS